MNLKHLHRLTLLGRNHIDLCVQLDPSDFEGPDATGSDYDLYDFRPHLEENEDEGMIHTDELAPLSFRQERFFELPLCGDDMSVIEDAVREYLTDHIEEIAVEAREEHMGRLEYD